MALLAGWNNPGFCVLHCKATTTMGKFELYTDKAGEFRFRLKAGNGQIILSSEGYTSKASALNGIKSVKANAGERSNYVRKSTAAGTSFNLLSANNRVIGSSQVYGSDASCETGVESVKSNAPAAEVVEL